MKEIVKKLFQKKFLSINIIHAVNVLLLLLYAGTFPMLIKQQEVLTTVLKSLPPEMLKAFGVDSQSMSSFEGYLAVKHIVPIWVIIVLLVAIPAATFISKSLDDNTGELIFAQPISRIKTGFATFISAFLQVLYFVIPSILIIIPICWIFGVEVHYTNYLYFAIESIGFSIFITGLIFCLDMFVNSSGKVMGIVMAYLIGSYGIYIVSKVITDLDFTKYFSFFYYYDPSSSLGSGNLNGWNVLLFTALGLGFLGLAIWKINNRDLTK